MCFPVNFTKFSRAPFFEDIPLVAASVLILSVFEEYLQKSFIGHHAYRFTSIYCSYRYLCINV